MVWSEGRIEAANVGWGRGLETERSKREEEAGSRVCGGKRALRYGRPHELQEQFSSLATLVCDSPSRHFQCMHDIRSYSLIITDLITGGLHKIIEFQL